MFTNQPLNNSFLFFLLLAFPLGGFSQVNLDSGLLAYYPFTINAGDSSGNNNHGAIFGNATTQGSLVIGDNATDYASLLNSLLHNRVNFSISAEVKFDVPHTASGGLNPYLSAAGASSSNELILLYNYQTSRWQFYLHSTLYSFHSAPPPPVGVWQHLVFQRSDSLVQWFRNGVCIYEHLLSNTPLNVSSGGLIIGQEQDQVGGSFDPVQSLAGEVDNLRFYNRPLTPTEIDSLYAGIPGMDAQAGIANYVDNDAILAGNQAVFATITNRSTALLDSVDITWEVNGLSQGTIAANGLALAYGQSTDVLLDSFLFITGQTYDIELWTSNPNGQMDQIPSNDTAFVTNLLAVTDTNRFALYTDGQTGYTNLNTIARDMNGLNTFTLEFWMKADPTANTDPQNGALIGINRQNRENELLIVLGGTAASNPGNIRILPGTQPLFIGTTIVADNSWHHIAYAQQGGIATLYIDGAIEGTFPTTALLAASNDWSLGQEYDYVVHTGFYKGYLDEVRVWAVARTQAQIQAMMNDNSALYQEPGLVSAYHFDPFKSDLVYDRQNCNLMVLYEGAMLVNENAPISDYTSDPIDICGCMENADLETWDQKGEEQYGDWQHDMSGSLVKQMANVVPAPIFQFPSFFVSPEEYLDVRIEFDVQVTGGDNDFVGFVFGYQGPELDPNFYDFWLFDWKGGTQQAGSALGVEGKILSRVQGDMTGVNPLLPFWGHEAGHGLTVIDSITGSGTGWESDTVYHYTFTYLSDRAIIEIDGDTIFDHFDSFPKGRFGFYALSQPNLIYSNFSYQPVADFPFETEEICEGESVLYQFNSPPQDLEGNRTISIPGPGIMEMGQVPRIRVPCIATHRLASTFLA